MSTTYDYKAIAEIYESLHKIGPSADWVNNTWLYSTTETHDLVIFENDNNDFEVIKVTIKGEEREEEKLYSSTSKRDALTFCTMWNE